MAIVNNCDSLSGFSLVYDGTYTTLSLDTADKTEGTASVSCYLADTDILELNIPVNKSLVGNEIFEFDIKSSNPAIPLSMMLLTWNGTAYVYSFYDIIPSTPTWEHKKINLLLPTTGDIPFLANINALLLTNKTLGLKRNTVKIDNITASSAVMVPLTVSASPPSATLTVGQAQIFSATPEGGTPSYAIDWIDNSNPAGPPLGSGLTYQFVASQAGNYAMFARVTDSTGATAISNVINITVTEIVPPPSTYTLSINSTPIQGVPITVEKIQ